MDIKEKALALHNKGYNCAQSVLCACGDYTGLDEATALSISGGFGMGARCGEMCGSVVGAVMALGMVDRFDDAANIEAKNHIFAMTQGLTKTFLQDHGCIRCQDLKKAGYSCPKLIEYSAELAEKMIKEKK